MPMINRFWRVASKFAWQPYDETGPRAAQRVFKNPGGLDFTWSVERKLSKEPDIGSVKIANMNPAEIRAAREMFRQAQGLVEGAAITAIKGALYQGFDGVTQLLMHADVYDIVEDDRSSRSTTWTEFKLGDGMLGLRDGVVKESMGGVDLNTMYGIIKNSMNLTDSAEAKAVFAEKYTGARVAQFNDGVIMQGPSRELLNELCGLLKVRWTITNGKLELVPIGRTIPGQAIVLAPNSGLLTYSTSSDGTISCSAHSLPAAVPGRQIFVRDEYGRDVGEVAYRIEHVRFSGDSRSHASMQLDARKVTLA